MKYEDMVKATNEIIDQYEMMNLIVRQIYYRLVSPPYNQPATRSFYVSWDRQLVKAREQGEVDETRIEDRTRELLGGDDGYSDIDSFLDIQMMRLEHSWMNYTKPLWTTQNYFPIVWIEKDALSRVVSYIADDYNVMTFPSRGYSSYSKMKEIINRFPEGKDIRILHFADLDPSGWDMTEDLEKRLTKYVPKGVNWHIERIALKEKQVKGLPSNPTKKADSRAKKYIKKFGDKCWELDALEPTVLQALIKENIERYIDMTTWDKKLKEIREEKERVKLKLKEITKKF